MLRLPPSHRDFRVLVAGHKDTAAKRQNPESSSDGMFDFNCLCGFFPVNYRIGRMLLRRGERVEVFARASASKPLLIGCYVFTFDRL
jgi:hypothetical protein